MNRHPDFESLPKTSHPDFRWVVGLMDEEQYHAEGWTVDEQGYWRADIPGLTEYAARRRERKAQRKAAWVARDDEYSEQMQALVESDERSV